MTLPTLWFYDSIYAWCHFMDPACTLVSWPQSNYTYQLQNDGVVLIWQAEGKMALPTNDFWIPTWTDSLLNHAPLYWVAHCKPLVRRGVNISSQRGLRALLLCSQKNVPAIPGHMWAREIGDGLCTHSLALQVYMIEEMSRGNIMLCTIVL